MNSKLLHTPDGVRDIFGDECAEKKLLEERIRKIFHSHGFRDIETPTFEYFDVFGNEIGTIPSRELYKFFDREGNTLSLRPDFTPSIARAAVRYFLQDPDPVRLCYSGNTFINNENLRGHMKENTQMGVELICDSSVDADAEVIAMAIESLLAAGLSDFQISLSNVQFMNSLVLEAGLTGEMEEELRALFKNRNPFGVEKLLDGLPIEDDLKDLLIRLPNLFGGAEILGSASSLCKGSESAAALERLKKIYSIMQMYGLEKYVSFDLGMTGSYQYYTGIIFRGFTYGSGEPVIKGGRYDRLLSSFGKDAPSVGFVVVAEQLLSAMRRQHLPLPTEEGPVLIEFSEEQREEAMSLASRMRSEGKSCALHFIPESGSGTAQRSGSSMYSKIIRLGGCS